MSYEQRKLLQGQQLVKKITLKLKGCKYADTLAEHSGYSDGTCRGFSPTCSTLDSYDEDIFRELVFCNSVLPAGTIYFGGLGKVNYTRQVLDYGESMGRRAMLDFVLYDGPHNDMYVVPYSDRQSDLGTFWGKLKARHPHFNGVEVVYSVGLRDDYTFDEPDWIHFTLFVDSASLDGDRMSFKCLDALSFVDEKKGLMPAPSVGQLASEITDLSTDFTVSGVPDYYYGALSDTVVVSMGNEAIQVTVTGGLTFDIVARSFRDSEKSNHSINSTVQLCIHLIDIHPVDLITTALAQYSEVPNSHIDDYTDLINSSSGLFFSDVFLPKPTQTKKIIDQCIKFAFLDFYSDPSSKKIVISRDEETNIQSVRLAEGENIIEGSVSVSTNESDQITHFMHKWGKHSFKDEYKIEYMPIDGSLIAGKKRNGINIGKEVKNFILTDSANDSLIGSAFSARRLSSNANIPKKVTLAVDSKDVGVVDGGNITFGSIVSIELDQEQNIDGSITPNYYKVSSIRDLSPGIFTLDLKLYQSSIINSGEVDFSITTDKINYDLSAEFFPADPGNYVIYIAPGVIIGCTDTSAYAFYTGSLGADVTLTIINRGQIVGMGGAGGNGNDFDGAQDSEDGEDGGGALNLTVPTTIDNGEGLILAGGGGAGGQDDGFLFPFDGLGGGGGQGFGVSLGGFHGFEGSARETSGGMLAPGGADYGYSITHDTRGGTFGRRGTDTIIYLTHEGSASVVRYGGEPGLAIKTNGNALTITAGNNNINIRGEIL